MLARGENASLALSAIQREPTVGIPTGLVHIMEHTVIERIAGCTPGTYIRDPHSTYIRMLRNAGVCMVDQYLGDNPLTMGDKGYESKKKTATTGSLANLDGIQIEEPEDVVHHMEKYAIPKLQEKIRCFDEREVQERVILEESATSFALGDEILKAGYGHLLVPTLQYYAYGYTPYFTAFLLYPEVIDKLISLEGEYAFLINQAVVKAYQFAGLPLYQRLDHDVADSRGVLCGMHGLERSWLPALARAISPAVNAGFTLLWHCDGNLMELIPRLIDCGVNGFQGFQYEDGMDYVEICKLKSRDGNSLVIQAGLSVTKELPFGSPADVKRQLCFLVENGPSTGLFLSFSSSCVPGTPWENIETALEGFAYYRKNGRR